MLKKSTVRTYTIDQAAELLGVSRASLYAAAKAGEIPVIKIKKRVLVPKNALDRMLDTGRAA